MQEFTVSNDLLSDPEALRARAARDGYLFFRGLADVDRLYALRRKILTLCMEAGWLDPSCDPMAGVAAEGVGLFEGNPAYMAVYNRVMKMEAFHGFAYQTALLGMLDTLFGEQTLVHPRNIARIVFPHLTSHTTPAHQDYIHIQGTEETWTAWIPLGDCPRELGSLAVLAGSHREGLYPVQPSLGAGGLKIDTDSMPYTWMASNFAAGDVVFFHSMTVHRGLPEQIARPHSSLRGLPLSARIPSRSCRLASAALCAGFVGRCIRRLALRPLSVLLARSSAKRGRAQAANIRRSGCREHLGHIRGER